MEKFVVVLAGGKGERFWPASRVNRPKQFLKLMSDKTMLRATIERTRPIVPIERTLIVANSHLVELMKETHPEIPEQNYIIEPQGKNTAPAICLAAANIVAKYGDGIMFVLASDHYIDPPQMFRDGLDVAKEVILKDDKLVLMGIQPTRAETGYGYIHVDEKIAEYDGIKCFGVKSFKEKPSRVKAQEFYFAGDYLWNSGNFMFRAGKILEEAEKYLPECANSMREYIENYGKPQANDILEKAFENITAVSIDVAILEKSEDVAVLWGAFRWDDVGSWGALERILHKDKFNNVISGKSDNLLLDTYETTIYSDNDSLVVAFGVTDLVIVNMGDVVLVMNKTRISEMRDLVKKIKENPDWKKYL
ncbi:mannose-1-phosphate guanylyltransferase [bacterium]|nr:mannose-1-phosphate guanylyltransferase [bacterium]